MNFLQLAQKLAVLADVSGQPSSIDNVRGEHARIVEWINQAWLEIQGAREQWNFMWARATPIAILAGVDLYEQPVDCRDIVTATFYLDDNAGNYAGVTFKPYQEFQSIARGAADPSRPQYWTIRPDNKIQLYPVPDAAYSLDFDYYKKPAYMVASTDTPSLPEHLHMAIVYLALMHYGEFEEAMSVIQFAMVNYNKYLLQMSNECLPEFKLGGALV